MFLICHLETSRLQESISLAGEVILVGMISGGDESLRLKDEQAFLGLGKGFLAGSLQLIIGTEWEPAKANTAKGRL